MYQLLFHKRLHFETALLFTLIRFNNQNQMDPTTMGVEWITYYLTTKS